MFDIVTPDDLSIPAVGSGTALLRVPMAVGAEYHRWS
jgi:hypothetical protein